MLQDDTVIMTEGCRKHSLLLNMKKTKETVFDFRKKPNAINQICIGNDGVEIVCKHKYLGTVTCGDLKGLVTSRNRSRKLIKDYIFLGN